MRSMRWLVLGCICALMSNAVAQDDDIDVDDVDTAAEDVSDKKKDEADKKEDASTSDDTAPDFDDDSAVDSKDAAADNSADSVDADVDFADDQSEKQGATTAATQKETSEKEIKTTSSSKTTESVEPSPKKETAEKEVKKQQEKVQPVATTKKNGATVPEPKSQQQPQPPVAEGFDTVDLAEPSGNWLYKRVWWEKAQGRYERIQDLMNNIFDARTPFLTKKAEAEQIIFDPLLLKTGLTQGELSVILTNINQEIELLKEKQEGTLTIEQKEFLQLVSAQQNQLKQLQLDVEALSKVDNELEVDVEKLMQQINRARSYEREAWDYLNAIAKELSDAHARKLYFAVETNQKNIQDILRYITTTMSEHFDQLLKIAKEQSERITQTIQSLKEKGIDFKKRAQEIEKKAAELEQTEQKKKHQEELEQAIAQAKTEASWSGKIRRVGSSITSGLESLWHTTVNTTISIWQWIKGLFGSAGQEESIAATASEIKPGEDLQPVSESSTHTELPVTESSDREIPLHQEDVKPEVPAPSEKETPTVTQATSSEDSVDSALE